MAAEVVFEQFENKVDGGSVLEFFEMWAEAEADNGYVVALEFEVIAVLADGLEVLDGEVFDEEKRFFVCLAEGRERLDGLEELGCEFVGGDFGVDEEFCLGWFLKEEFVGEGGDFGFESGEIGFGNGEAGGLFVATVSDEEVVTFAEERDDVEAFGSTSRSG